jgi:hypothetical protein
MKTDKYTIDEAINFIFTQQYTKFIGKGLKLLDKTDEQINEETVKLVTKISKVFSKEEQKTAILLHALNILTAKLFSDTAIRRIKKKE